MSHYHDADDLKILREFKNLAPAEFSGFVEVDKIVGRDDGKIPRKYRELIALAVACTTQCPYSSMSTPATPRRQGPPERRWPRPRSSRLPCGRARPPRTGRWPSSSSTRPSP